MGVRSSGGVAVKGGWINALFAVAVALAIFGAFECGSRSDVAAMESLETSDYARMTCSEFICSAHGIGHVCSAADFWNGCGGRLTIVGEFANAKEAIGAARPGDVIVFQAGHVAGYVGGGELMDSTPERGVSRRSMNTLNRFDLWYSGAVRIARWKAGV